MKKTLIVSSVLAAVLSIGGCKSNDAKTVAEVPPPSPSSPITAPQDSFGGGPVVLKGGKTPASAPGYIEPAGDSFTVGNPSPAPVGAGAGGNYVVRDRDTLWSIAHRHYGSGQRWKDIVAANPGLTPEKMRVGMAIVLP